MAKLFPGDIQQMPVMPDAIRAIVARLSDSNSNVHNAASSGFIELAKHGHFCGSFK